MFKKAKRANFRRRNESDEDEQEEGRQPLLAPTLFGPVGEEIPFMESSNNSGTTAPSSTDNIHSNGFLSSPNIFRAVKKDKKPKEPAALTVSAPTKASLLSFDDEEGNLSTSAVLVSWSSLVETCCDDSFQCYHPL